MAERIVLHIGLMKTGTSFIQSALGAGATELAAADAVYLGSGLQSKAALDLAAIEDPGTHRGHWVRLAERARRAEAATAIVSMEFISFARGHQIEWGLEQLKGMDVQVVVTVRDQLRAIPAQWQTFVRNRGVDEWSTYLTRIQARRHARTRAARTFHRAQDAPEILADWSRAPLAVVTVPPSGAARDVLWRRFCDAAGVDAGELDLSGLHDNPSLGFASCDYLRLLNQHLDGVPAKGYRRGIRPLARESLVALRSAEGRPTLDQDAAAYALQRNRDAVAALPAYRVVGSLSDLPDTVDLGDYPGAAPSPDPAEVLRAARAAWEHVAGLEPSIGAAPADLPELVAGAARGLRLAHGW